MEALKVMAKKLPTTKEELMQVDYMTEFRVNQYESVILDTTKHFHKQRMDHLKTVAALRQEQMLEEERNRPMEARSSGGRKGRGGGRTKKKMGRKKKAGGTTARTGAARGRGGGVARSSVGGSRGRGSIGGGGSMGAPKSNRFGAGSTGQYSYL